MTIRAAHRSPRMLGFWALIAFRSHSYWLLSHRSFVLRTCVILRGLSSDILETFFLRNGPVSEGCNRLSPSIEYYCTEWSAKAELCLTQRIKRREERIKIRWTCCTSQCKENVLNTGAIVKTLNEGRRANKSQMSLITSSLLHPNPTRNG